MLDPAALPARPCIVFANHSSHLDFAVIWAALPGEFRSRTRPVAGRDYWGKSLPRRWLAGNFFNALLIERKNVTVANNPLKTMLAALDAGDSLIVFPEGTRNPDGQIHEFKPGLFHLAHARPAISLVPIYLENLNRILPKGDIFPVPLLASIAVGKPLQFVENEIKPGFLARARSALEMLRSS